ncbi:NADH:flavin oxidoreductase/NADH oxidase family protein [Sphingorhabdus sp.]|jgi:2,4-dienoyl-CoA reductase-like NADH-dependent reductase (Old Yellow Enzyme family)|uniref:NADH:flavin oxidoreductase/NADH oxidase family protein n=1 Tax=Sphingorhabdus sp. TaxID=1902408 RepID=UPI003BAEB802|nr:NADH:flavin oxidoreductase/NADH oxidase family protein [Sphingomonadales bacterium]MBK9431101.1 NADH:flavin oxidoreductase/NADH oxidase family protein [Sphingomonadales bacterium]
MRSLLAEPLTLPCGATLPNRLAKAAMTEGLADPAGRPTAELDRLYGIWSDGGAGLSLSGNIHIDRDHLERPGNVLIDREPDAETRALLERWAQAATRNGNHFWAQISHAGRQTQKIVNHHPKAPSAVKLGLPGGQFGQPVALSEEEILALIGRFATAARVCKETGFTGVQIHAAHGYLISQFLSPLANLRDDRWGGSLENRTRMLMFTINSVRTLVGPDFPVSVKLNSADFQRGGFAFEDSLQVARWLQDAGVDLIEISGGTYEQPRLMGVEGLEPAEEQNVAASTLAREAYFVDFANAMREHVCIPLMVTGGFRSRSAMEQAIKQGAADVIGLGRPLCYMPDGAKRLLGGMEMLPRKESELALFPPALQGLTRFKMLRAIDSFACQYWYYSQLYALGQTGRTAPDRTVFQAFREVEATHKTWMKARAKSQ